VDSRAELRDCEVPTKEIVREALQYYPNADLSYDDWIRIAFALYAGLGDAGRDIWEDWSAGSSKNDPETTAKKWPSFASVRGITIKTLYYFPFKAVGDGAISAQALLLPIIPVHAPLQACRRSGLSPANCRKLSIERKTL
jgi:hypothetical protein